MLNMEALLLWSSLLIFEIGSISLYSILRTEDGGGFGTILFGFNALVDFRPRYTFKVLSSRPAVGY
jgi:hypothetical protein